MDEASIKAVDMLASKLIAQGCCTGMNIQQRRDRLIERWKALQAALNVYRDRLYGALEVHVYSRDVDDTLSRIAEKAVAVTSQDTGSDLEAVESLLRKQEVVERDISAIQDKVLEHDMVSRRLKQKHPQMNAKIEEKLGEVKRDWSELQESVLARRQALESAFTNHRFSRDLKELQLWALEMIKKMDDSCEMPSNMVETQAALELHRERKAEIDGRRSNIEMMKTIAAPGEQHQYVVELEEIEKKLDSTWAQCKTRLDETLQWYTFKEQADQIEGWMASKEAFLTNDDIGQESLNSVDILLRKHEAFEKATLAALSNKVQSLKNYSEDILKGAGGLHYNSVAIRDKLDRVKQRADRLKDSCYSRRTILLSSRKLHKFLRNAYEVEGWIIQKQQIALDESYRDATNLQSKIQKHCVFESEISANEYQVNNVIAEGQALINNNDGGGIHFAADEIQSRLRELEAEWKKLRDACSLKSSRLSDAYKALVFSRSLDDLEAWIEEVEDQLQSEDHGKDLTGVTKLLKRHALLESDVLNKGETCEQLKQAATSFEKCNHFMKDEIQERLTSVINRYNWLEEPMRIRRENLEDALLLHQLLRDIEDEMQWLREKEPFIASTNFGASLSEVQSLQKKHQSLETELLPREAVVNGLCDRAEQMIGRGHFASDRIDQVSSELSDRFIRLKDLARVRRCTLLDALESQMFYSEANEAKLWLRERRPVVTSAEYGKDEEGVNYSIKKVETVDRELTSFQQSTVNRLGELCRSLVERSHFDSKNLHRQWSEIESEFKEMSALCKSRWARLTENKKLFKFLQEADEVCQWISDQTVVAASEDYGSDVEHVELLIQAFDNFVTGLNGSEKRVMSCVQMGSSLMAEGINAEAASVKMHEIQQMWEELKELANARQEALAGAKQVHTFDRCADETIEWIREKDSALITAEEYGNNLETVQALLRKHTAFEAELVAVKEQVESVVEEAGRLSGLFPDARDHIEVKHEETLDAWTQLLEKCRARKDKLHQAEQLQEYFDEYAELMSWINEMMAKITSAAELGGDVAAAESTLVRHTEHKSEIDSRRDALDRFYRAGDALVDQGHFLSDDVQEKINILKQRDNLLFITWEQRQRLYKQNLDALIFRREADSLESWLQVREPLVKDENLGDSIAQVEELIRKHEDFEKTIEAQEQRFEALKRITLVEEEFAKQKELERSNRMMEKERAANATARQRSGPNVMENVANDQRYWDNGGLHMQLKNMHLSAGRDGKNDEDEFDSSRNMSSAAESRSSSTLPTKRVGSIVSLFSDRMKKADIKRAESMRVENGTGNKKSTPSRRTPSFTTRRRTNSFRKNDSSPPPVEIQGILDRKQELQSGGKKAPVRSWKSFYTVLCGQLLCFFKDQDDFAQSKAATSPLIIYKAYCKKADDYTKRKHVFRLRCSDGTELLFSANSENEMEDWVNKISFHAQLPPSLQLLSYDDPSQKNSAPQEQQPPLRRHAGDSSSSSNSSTPEVGAIKRNSLSGGGRDRRPSAAPPPIPARAIVTQLSQPDTLPPLPSLPPPSVSTSPVDSTAVHPRNRLFISGPEYQNYQQNSSTVQRHSTSFDGSSAPIDYSTSALQTFPNSNPNGRKKTSTLPSGASSTAVQRHSYHQPISEDEHLSASTAAAEYWTNSEAAGSTSSFSKRSSSVITSLFKKKKSSSPTTTSTVLSAT